MNPESRLQHRSTPESESLAREEELLRAATAATAATSHSTLPSSPEELLRHDRAHTQVPEPVTRRLADSLRKDPNPTSRPTATQWWKRLFGHGS